jgi:LDH2 family malate/lactate/ureidoglycolate dehydrogenase
MIQRIKFIPFDVSQKFIADVFTALGVPEADARVCAEILTEADKRGIDSHGIARLKTMYYDRLKEGIQFAKTDFELVRQGPTTAVVDGHNGMGHVIAKRSMALAIEKAKQYGMGMVAVRNSTHYGIAGYYVMMAADAGMIGITGTNARPSVAPTFGIENMLGTNPLTFGLPTDEEFPFVLDCATSLSQRGKIEVYAREGREIPEGWVIGENGNARTDSKQILTDLVKGKAALTPLGGIGEETAGYKGYGYSTVVEILSAALQGGSFLKMLVGVENGKKAPYRLGHFFMAMDISAFTELNDFKKTAGDILRQLRAAKKAPGHEKIYTAGEKEYLTWLDRKDKGVPLVEETQKEMMQMIQELGLKGYETLLQKMV